MNVSRECVLMYVEIECGNGCLQVSPTSGECVLLYVEVDCKDVYLQMLPKSALLKVMSWKVVC